MTIPTLDGITVEHITSSRLRTRVLFSGPTNGIPVLFIHGNASSATFWEEVMLALPDGFRGIAHDQRGYGDADPDKKIDATRGMGDLADDAFALLDHLNIDKAHVVGHSMGGSVIWRMMMEAPQRLLTVTQVAPGSPFGFGGSKGVDGEMNFPDSAGAGAGTVNPAFPPMLAANDRSDIEGGPRFVMNSFYWKPPFKPAREEDLLSSMLSTHVGEQDYPGDAVSSSNWPTAAPGKFGAINGLAPKHVADVTRLYKIDPKPPVLWVRGSDDQIVSNTSMFDVGFLGSVGAIPGWPGVDIFPPQPMIDQTRAVLDQYKAHGGSYREEVIADAGHTPYIEKPEAFNAVLHGHITA